MKNESVKIIADLMLSAEVPQFAKEKLVQIMRIETLGTKAKGFKMTDYVDSKSKGYRPALEGVYYDESGYEVATEGHILIYRKVEVADNLKNRIVLPNGEFVSENNRYPNWKAVVPNDAEFEPFIVDFDKVEEFAKDWKAKKKICGKVVPMITFKNRYFNLDLFVKFIKAMKYAETNIIKLNPKNDTTPVSFGSYDNMGGLIMPMILPTEKRTEENEIYTL